MPAERATAVVEKPVAHLFASSPAVSLKEEVIARLLNVLHAKPRGTGEAMIWPIAPFDFWREGELKVPLM